MSPEFILNNAEAFFSKDEFFGFKRYKQKVSGDFFK
jgi:hypothetical protein